MPPAYLGEFEQLVLLAVFRLGDTAYGVPIRQMIEESTGRRVAIGAVYTTLDRLQTKGLLRSRVGDPTPERGGRRRKFYRLAPSGRAALARAYESWSNMTRGIVPRLESL